jgi:hypothetical protein
MKRYSSTLFVILFLFLTPFLVTLFAQNADEKESSVTVSWDEFKDLLKLDANELVIPLETFQKLLAQTGIKTIPTHYLMAGNVILSRVEFQKLVDQMKAPEDPALKPPFDYLITKAFYSGKIKEGNTEFMGTFNIHVLKSEGYLKVPILPLGVAIKDLKINGKPALVVNEEGFHKIVISETGIYTVLASFSMKSFLENGPNKIDLSIQQTPITLLELELPLKDIDVEIPQAQQIMSSLKGQSTLISAILSPARTISVRWRKKAPITEKIPPKLYAEVYHLISIEDDALKINSEIVFNILHSEMDGVRLSVLDNMNVLDVTGEGVGEWQEDEQDGQRLINIPFTYGQKGSVTVKVNSEASLSDSGLVNTFAGFTVVDCVRETGFIGVELNTSAEVILTDSQGLEKIAVQKLPHLLFNKSVKPLLLGFKYLNHPYEVVLDVKKHEKVAMPVATINSANIVTMFTEDGKIIHRIVYQVRNSAKQFLEIKLPENADVWTVFVGNQPVESSLSEQGKLLVPLIRSHSVNDQLNTFPVEIIYAKVADRFSLFGSRGSKLPEADLMISQLMWSVYLPYDYSYYYFSSTLEREEIIRGINLFSTVKRRYDENAMRELYESGDLSSDELKRDKMEEAYGGEDSRSRFSNIPMQEQQITSQIEAEIEFGGLLDGLKKKAAPAIHSSGAVSTGVLPIQIQIPTGGQVYRFARTIIKSDDPLLFKVFYTRSWVNNLFWWLIFLVFIVIMVFNRNRFTRLGSLFKKSWDSIFAFYKTNEVTMKRITKSRITPFVLFGLVVVVWSFSRPLTLILLFLLWINIVTLLLNWHKKSSEKKSKEKSVPVSKPGVKAKKTDELK